MMKCGRIRRTNEPRANLRRISPATAVVGSNPKAIQPATDENGIAFTIAL